MAPFFQTAQNLFREGGYDPLDPHNMVRAFTLNAGLRSGAASMLAEPEARTAMETEAQKPEQNLMDSYNRVASLADAMKQDSETPTARALFQRDPDDGMARGIIADASAPRGEGDILSRSDWLNKFGQSIDDDMPKRPGDPEKLNAWRGIGLALSDYAVALGGGRSNFFNTVLDRVGRQQQAQQEYDQNLPQMRRKMQQEGYDTYLGDVDKITSIRQRAATDPRAAARLQLLEQLDSEWRSGTWTKDPDAFIARAMRMARAGSINLTPDDVKGMMTGPALKPQWEPIKGAKGTVIGMKNPFTNEQHIGEGSIPEEAKAVWAGYKAAEEAELARELAEEDRKLKRQIGMQDLLNQRAEKRALDRQKLAAQQQYLASQPVKNFMDVSASYERVKKAAQTGGAGGDLALVYAYMKMLDPGSTVREGEFANATNAGTIPESVWQHYNYLVGGAGKFTLPPEVKASFVENAAQQMRGALSQKKAMDKYFFEQQGGALPDDLAASGNAPTKTASLEDVRAYAGQKKITEEQAIAEFEKDGFTISGKAKQSKKMGGRK